MLATAGAGFAAAYAVTPGAVDPSTAPLVRVELPGFSVELPRARSVDDRARRYAAGARVAHDPAGVDGRIEVRWASVAPMTADALAREARTLAAPARQVAEHTVDLAGNPVFAGSFEGDGRAAVTFAYCRDAGQLVIVATALAAADDQLDRLHLRISRSIECLPGLPRDQRDLLVPRFELPGVGYVAGTQPPTFAGADGSAYVFHATVGDATELFADRPQLLAEMLAAMGLPVRADALELREYDGRRYASAVVEQGGAGVRITVGAFYCEPLGLSFIAQHQGPGQTPIDDAVAALARASCPPADYQPVGVADAFGAACDQDHGLACYQLARGIEAGDFAPGDRDATALKTRACELGVAAACEDDPEEKP
jgi:hypothetical protein